MTTSIRSAALSLALLRHEPRRGNDVRAAEGEETRLTYAQA